MKKDGRARMTTQATLWSAAGALVGVAGLAFAADHRRAKRRNLDSVGWVPWNLIQIFAMILAAAAAALALKA
jgi:hypothetical protein